MKSLIIGANSLGGSNMYRYLSDLNEDFIGTKLPGQQEVSEFDEELAEMDMLHVESIQEVLKKYSPDYIFNFAEYSSVGHSWKAPGDTVDYNVNGTLNLFEAIRKCGQNPVVILIGAGEEYGQVDFRKMPISETERLHPRNIYAASKACQTMMAQIYHRAYGMKLIVARTFNMIGPGQSVQFSISDFCRQAALIKEGLAEPVLRVGNWNIQRDFTDVRDLVRAYWLLAQKGRYGQIYNVGRGESVKIRVIVEHLQSILGRDIQVQIERERMRPLDIPKQEGDISKLQEDTGWCAQLSLQQSVQDMMQYWTEQIKEK